MRNPFVRLLIASTLLSLGCKPLGRANYIGGPGGVDAGDSSDANPGSGSKTVPNCDSVNPPPDGDQDNDGYTPSEGDCNDCNPSINPGAIQIPGDPTDYACNGKPGVIAACSPMNGAHDETSLAQAMDQCDPRFFKGAMLVGPANTNDIRARKVEPNFGVIMPRAGINMAYISNGIAADKSDPAFDKTNEEDPGTDLNDANTAPHPYPNIKPNPMCSGSTGAMSMEPSTVNDYTELVVNLHAPTNANSFSFDFQFFSAEYPSFVCTEFNDEFLVLQESKSEFSGTETNIAFDMSGNPVTVNNGFFTVCTNDPTQTYTQHCKQPVSGIAGTGFDDAAAGGIGGIPGGSTGWLTTTSPATPGEDITLHFIIYDEGDHILDSSALIDNFRWGATAVMTPVTTPIS